MSNVIGPGFTGSHTLRLPDEVFWEPKEDITAYELAQAMPIILRMSQGDWQWNYPQDLIPALPSGVSRHFRLESRS
ncbi:MAG: hypothetical protein EHM78_27230 [Myxococcaceae bacterium]|nr:MAG: hypothetical protein EHM78_27230 [Myxococcaceae bacterium]